MSDLSLVPIDELTAEIESRCTAFILAYSTPKDRKERFYFRYGKGSWYESVQLSSILNNDILNNWNGELQTLQRINEDDD